MQYLWEYLQYLVSLLRGIFVFCSNLGAQPCYLCYTSKAVLPTFSFASDACAESGHWRQELEKLGLAINVAVMSGSITQHQLGNA